MIVSLPSFHGFSFRLFDQKPGPSFTHPISTLPWTPENLSPYVSLQHMLGMVLPWETYAYVRFRTYRFGFSHGPAPPWTP